MVCAEGLAAELRYGGGSDETAQHRVRSTILSKWAGPLVAALAVAAVSGVIALLTPHVPAPYLLVLYVLVVMAVAVVWGTGMAVFDGRPEHRRVQLPVRPSAVLVPF